MTNSNQVNVVILGGGVAGAAAALALARHNIGGVIVLEATRFGGPRIGESLLPDSRRLLELLGVWPDFLAQAHEPCLGSRSAWGRPELGFNDFLFNPAGAGWHLDRRRFDSCLAASAREAGTDLRLGARYRWAEAHDSRWRIGFVDADGATRTVDTRYVVDATGPGAVFSRRQGAQRLEFSRTLFVYGFFDGVRPTRWTNLTLLEAVEHGWWYAAHLPDERLAVAIAADIADVNRLGLRGASGWLRALRRTEHVVEFVGRGQRPREPLVVRHAPSFLSSRPVGESWLAVGDAASSFDPITGQGIHKALADGLLAADYIAGVMRGTLSCFDGYAQAVAQRFESYVASCGYFYELETRWPGASFWRARQGSIDRHFDQAAVGVPGGVADQRNGDGEADE